jgi:CRP/FNR family transcriptional regulator, cyclic AMP receptor protein
MAYPKEEDMSELEQTLRFFSNARVLRMLDPESRRKLIDASEALTFQDGEVMVREGDPGDALFIIVDGVASVVIDDMGNSKPVAELTDGAFFGEMAVITDQPRSATVSARGRLSVLKIPKEAVLAILEENPKLKELIAKIGVARTEETLEKLLED